MRPQPQTFCNTCYKMQKKILKLFIAARKFVKIRKKSFYIRHSKKLKFDLIQNFDFVLTYEIQLQDSKTTDIKRVCKLTEVVPTPEKNDLIDFSGPKL